MSFTLTLFTLPLVHAIRRRPIGGAVARITRWAIVFAPALTWIEILCAGARVTITAFVFSEALVLREINCAGTRAANWTFIFLLPVQAI